MKKRFKTLLISMIPAILMLLSSCATVGKDFPSNDITSIQIGKSSKNDILDAYGSPWRKGIEDGYETWTYGYYHYKLIGQTSTKDLVVRYDKNGIVRSYSFNESALEE